MHLPRMLVRAGSLSGCDLRVHSAKFSIPSSSSSSSSSSFSGPFSGPSSAGADPGGLSASVAVDKTGRRPSIRTLD